MNTNYPTCPPPCHMQGRDVKFSISTLLPCLILFIIPPYVSVLFLKIFIGAQLIYNVVLVSGVQQNESVIQTHISTLF